MLVLKGQAVDPVAFVADVPVFVLIFGDQALAAAGVAGQGVGSQGEGLVDDPLGDQRTDGSDEAAGVAAGICNAAASCNGASVLIGQLREAVGPGGVHAVGGGGVDDADIGTLCKGHGFLCGCVGQAEEGDITFKQGFASGLGVLTGVAGQGQDGKVLPARQTVRDPQAGGSGAAVDEYALHAITSFTYWICFSTWETEGPPTLMRFSTQATRSMAS